MKGERLITFDGETHNMTEWARRLGISGSALNGRFQHGWSVEKALTTPPREQPSMKPIKRLTFNGETHSIRTWAQRTGLPPHIIYDRIYKNWTTEETLTLPKGYVKEKPKKLHKCTGCVYAAQLTGVTLKKGGMMYCNFMGRTGHARVRYVDGVKVDMCPRRQGEQDG